MPVLIHEFSRAFEPSNDPLYGWVSGGYAIANPIFRESHTVPDVIVKAVKEDKFAINDNYRPYPDKYALIARDVYDIDYSTKDPEATYRNAYSVLAVANYQNDGGRETTGYRYFWLDRREATVFKLGLKHVQVKNILEIDGIRTLLDWWWRYSQNNQTLMFSMEEAALKKVNPFYQIESRNKIFSLDKNNRRLRSDTQLKTRLKESEMEDLFNSIISSHIKIVELYQYIFSQKRLTPLSWAYNVRKLEKPDTFLGIFYSPDTLIQDSDLLPVQDLDDRRGFEKNIADSSNRHDSPIIELVPDTKSIQILITKIATKYANSRDTDYALTKTLLDYKLQYSNYDWQNFIDPTAIKQNTPLGFIYKALLYILCPEAESVDRWYNYEFIPAIDDRLRSEKNPFYKNNPNDRLALALGIQTAIFDEIMSHEQSLELQNILLINIYDDIRKILENLYKLSNWQRKWECDEYLLSTDTIWKRCWTEYQQSCYSLDKRQFNFHLKDEFWDNNQGLWLTPQAQIDPLLNAQSLKNHFQYLHKYIISLIYRANNLYKSMRQNELRNYKNLADLISNSEPLFSLLFSRLSGYEVKRKRSFIEQDNLKRLNQILKPTVSNEPPPPLPKPPSPPLEDYILFLASGIPLAVGTFFLPKLMSLYVISVVGIMVFLSSNFNRSGINLPTQFFLVLIGFYLSILLIIPIRLPGYVIVLFIAIVSFIVSTILSKQLKRGGY